MGITYKTSKKTDLIGFFAYMRADTVLIMFETFSLNAIYVNDIFIITIFNCVQKYSALSSILIKSKTILMGGICLFIYVG